MTEQRVNLWHCYDAGYTVVITTNGGINSRSECVMGRGVAAQAKARFPNLPRELGARIIVNKMRVEWFSQYRLFTFPVKFHWSRPADIDLIKLSCFQLINLVDRLTESTTAKIYLPRPGCGNGGLSWMDVRPQIEPLLDDRFVVVNI